MKKTFKTLVLAAALGSAGLVAMAQPMGTHDGMMEQGRHGKMDAAKMETMLAQRAAALKAQLKLAPEQEPAWNSFVAAMKPDAKAMPKHPAREELDKLSTPERIDKMRTLRDQQHADMSAAMDKRGEATKTFYAVLTPEQKKVFDANAMRRHGDGRMGGPRHGKGPAPTPPASK